MRTIKVTYQQSIFLPESIYMQIKNWADTTSELERYNNMYMLDIETERWIADFKIRDMIIGMMYKFDLAFDQTEKQIKECIFTLLDPQTDYVYTISPLGNLYVRKNYNQKPYSINKKNWKSKENFVEMFKFLFKYIEKTRETPKLKLSDAILNDLQDLLFEAIQSNKSVDNQLRAIAEVLGEVTGEHDGFDLF